MKKIIALCMVVVLVLVGCSNKKSDSKKNIDSVNTEQQEKKQDDKKDEIINSFTGLNDDDLQRYIEDEVYTELLDKIDNDKYFIENVSTTYISKEYIEELSYNTKLNVYFGYTENELEQQFQGKKYVFTLGENNQTIVQEMEEVEDYSYNKILKNVAIGSGVILVCVTVSALTAGAAPAISVILATSAKTATTYALSSGAISGVSAGIITGVQTGNFDEALKAGMEAGSESFKWGAISGAIVGGAGKTIALKGATSNGLSMNEAAIIQRDEKWSIETIKELKSFEEYQIYKDQGLVETEINGAKTLVQKIDLTSKIEGADGKILTNAERIKQNLSPIDPITKERYELHHINQEADGVLAILHRSVHNGNASILNKIGKRGVHNPESGLSDSAWAKIRNSYWKGYLEKFAN